MVRWAEGTGHFGRQWRMWLSGAELVWRAGRDEALGARSCSHVLWSVGMGSPEWENPLLTAPGNDLSQL